MKFDRRWAAKGRMAITSHWSWDAFLRAGAWAFDRTYPDDVLAPGTEALVYLTRDGGRHGLAGLVVFQGEAEIEARGPFALYDKHRRFQVIRHLREPISLADLAPQLEMFAGATNYGQRLQGQPLKPVPDGDYRNLRARVLAAPSQG